MDRKGLTINETSEKLNVTKQCIYNKLKILNKELKPHTFMKNGIKYITDDGFKIIYASLNSTDSTDDLKDLNNSNDLFNPNIALIHKEEIENLKTIYEKYIDDLKSQILYLQNESTEKNRLLSERDKLLENMQVLLKDQKLLIEQKIEEEKKPKWRFWKS